MTQRQPAPSQSAPPDPASLYAELSRALDRVQALYTELEALSRSQDELVERDEGAELLEHLAKRQVLIDRLTEADRSLLPLRNSWDGLVRGVTEAQKAGVTGRLAAIADTASWIAHRDETAAQRLQRRRDALAEELTGLSRSRTARTAYGPGAPDGGPRFQDREG